jgi:hypothetical protein
MTDINSNIYKQQKEVHRKIHSSVSSSITLGLWIMDYPNPLPHSCTFMIYLSLPEIFVHLNNGIGTQRKTYKSPCSTVAALVPGPLGNQSRRFPPSESRRVPPPLRGLEGGYSTDLRLSVFLMLFRNKRIEGIRN